MLVVPIPKVLGGTCPYVLGIRPNPRCPKIFGVVVIPGGGFPSLARFLADDWVIGRIGEADLGLPPGIFKGS